MSLYKLPLAIQVAMACGTNVCHGIVNMMQRELSTWVTSRKRPVKIGIVLKGAHRVQLRLSPPATGSIFKWAVARPECGCHQTDQWHLLDCSRSDFLPEVKLFVADIHLISVVNGKSLVQESWSTTPES